MRARAAALFTALLTAAGMLAFASPASAQHPFPGDAVFSAYATGTQQHVHLIEPAPMRIVDVDTSLSGASADSQNLKPIQSEAPLKSVIVPQKLQDGTATSGKNSYARGAAAELGLATDTSILTSDQNQLILSKLLEAAAPPSSTKTATDQLLEIPGDPLLYAKAAYEHASALWNAGFCPLGQPISYGDNSLATAEVLNTAPGGAPDTVLGQPNSKPLIATNTDVNARQANSSKSFTYLFPNGDGTFGVGSATQMTIAPITIGKGTPSAVTIEVAGTWTLRVEASGKPGGATVSFLPDSGDNTAIVIRFLDAAGNVLNNGAAQLTLGQIIGQTGITIPQNPLIQGTIGQTPAHAIGDSTKPPTSSKNGNSDGTVASAAGDVLNLQVINQPPFNGATIALGHVEAKAVAPAGGLDCPLPVSKTFNDSTGAPAQSVNGGSAFSWKITFPSVDIAKELACTLTNVKVTDVASVIDGTPSATISGASNGGVVGSSTVGPSKSQTATVNWSLPDYHPGDPPVVLTVNATAGNTGAGVIENVAKVTATLSNCTGGVAGQAFVNNAALAGKAATINGTAVAGLTSVKASFGGPAVAPARLATTGEQPWIPALGGGLLLGAMALWRGRRRLHPLKVKQ